MGPDTRMLVIGFWPGLWDPEQIGHNRFEIKEYEGFKSKLEYLESLPGPQFRGVMWGLKGKKVVAGLVTSMADDLYAYMRYYSDNDPNGWFNVEVKCSPEGYEFHLLVNHVKTAKRMQKVHGVKPSQMQIIHKPLVCEVPNANVFSDIKPYLKASKGIEVRLLDQDLVFEPYESAPQGYRIKPTIDPEVEIDRNECVFKNLRFKLTDN